MIAADNPLSPSGTADIARSIGLVSIAGHTTHGVNSCQTPCENKFAPGRYFVVMKKAKDDKTSDSYKRMLLAAKRLRGWEGNSAIARGVAEVAPDLEISDQRIGNWRTRGVAKDALLAVCEAIGCRPAWLMDNKGTMEDLGVGHGDPDIQEAIELLSQLHGRMRSKAVGALEEKVKELLSSQRSTSKQA